ncbi:MAG: hypothetical protein GX654_06445 [Desulfatiglans sp.]|jgi:hypothetical protein|nr:hypothetical protein [Desulfatiglans sp.]
MERKACYGILDKVFPFGREGLRATPPGCFDCPERLQCLKTAIGTKDGLEMRSENLRRIPVTGIIDRIKRWSQKKELGRLSNEKRRNDN